MNVHDNDAGLQAREISSGALGMARAVLLRAVAALAPAYRPRRPTETVLYGIVRDYLESFLAYARDSYETPLPRYVEQELRGYLRCGVFAHGFVHCRCELCGYDLLVAFSCKGRGVCPSCAGRRMCDVAARLVDRVVPSVPLRQWVLSLPFDLRGLAAFRADVLSAFVRIFVEAVLAHYRARGRSLGINDPQSGAVTFVQRFGSSLNLNVHFHVCLLDGVFDRDPHGRVRFHAAAEPTRGEMESIVRRVHKRAASWLARRGAQATTPSCAPLEACARIAMRRGTVSPTAAIDGDAAAAPTPADEQPRELNAVDIEGFNLNASVAIAADDDLGRERLLRYGARPPLALERLRIMSGGRIAYQIKKVAHGTRDKVRVMTPLEFLARLSALIPPPRYPLVRYHGVLAPASKWRGDVVPRPREPTAGCVRAAAKPLDAMPQPGEPSGRSEHGPQEVAGAAPDATVAHEELSPQPKLAPGVMLLTPNVLSVRHWERLLASRLLAPAVRVDWATLLQRTFQVDVLACPKCSARIRVLDQVTEPAIVRLALESVGLPTEVPRPARARDPTGLLAEPE